MLQFVIGLGINSVHGGYIEHALSDVYTLDDFWIEPIVEIEYELTTLTQLQRRAAIFAERMKSTFDAEAYFGVASGQIIVHTKNHIRAPVRAYMIVGIVGHHFIAAKLLNPADLQWQITKRVYALASDGKSVSDTLSYIRKYCTLRALPRLS